MARKGIKTLERERMGIMDKELQDYYEARLDMFSTKGWQDLIEDIQNMKTATNTLSGIQDIHKLGFRQGEINQMDWILGLKDISEKAYEELKNEDAS
ncbi:hypothetical protein KC963_01290 [Candidatus Saccharibacteria bacterium]|nr:hypothetical protein [Candidatus Saccharibacteria bacterium]